MTNFTTKKPLKNTKFSYNKISSHWLINKLLDEQKMHVHVSLGFRFFL